jgi:hypothetical protein
MRLYINTADCAKFFDESSRAHALKLVESVRQALEARLDGAFASSLFSYVLSVL